MTILFSAIAWGELSGQCITSENLVVTPLPVGGQYQAGQTVQFCYTINSYSNLSVNWHLGIGVQMGPDWDAGSIAPVGQPTSLDGNGVWLWDSNVIGSATGMNSPYWGWYYDSSSGGLLDGNPGNNYGDCCSGPWTYCWTITTNSCPPGSNGASLSVTIHNYADGELGSWTNFDCGGDVNYSFNNATLSCIQCGTPNATVIQNETCPGDADGSVTVSMTGGAGPFSYSWNTVPVQTTQIATGLTAGNYTVTVTDANSCVVTDNVTIAVGTATDATINNINATNTLCFNDAPVQLTTVQPGGTFSGNGVNSTGLFDPATANLGVNTVTYSLGGPCPDSQTIDITVVPNADATITDPIPNYPNNTFCVNDPPEQLTASDPGGSWTGPGVSPTGLFDPNTAGVGNHAITYTIANPCGDSDVINIIVFGAADASMNNINANNELCANDPAAQITTVQPGGTFSGNGVSVSGLFDPSTVTAGTHTVTYSITGNCPASETMDILVIANAAATIDPINPTNQLCLGNAPVQMTAATAGGIWSGTGVSPSGMFDPATAGLGSHTVTYTVLGLCGDLQTMDVGVIDVTFTQTIADVDCFNAATGGIQIQNETGTAPHLFSLDGGSNTQATGTFSGLNAGNFNLVVVDANGCTSQSVPVIITEPTAIVANAVMDQQSNCGLPDGQASVTAAGGTVALGFQYSWDSNPVQTTAVATMLLPLAYTVTVTDDNGCAETANVTVTSTPQISVSITSSTDALCFGGCDGQAVALCGGTAIAPFSYLWDDPSAQTTPTAPGLCAGTYTVTSTDAVGCTATESVTILEPTAVLTAPAASTTPLCIGESADLTANASGGTAPYATYLWTSAPVDALLTSNAQDPTVWPAVSTTYTIVATDANGCSSTPNDVTVEVLPPLSLDVTRPLFSADTGICPYDFAVIDLQGMGGDGNYNYYLLPDLTNAITLPMTVQPGSTTIYDFSVSDGCTTPPAFATSTITVFTLPIVDFSGDELEGCDPYTEPFTDQTSPAPVSWNWNFGDPDSPSNTETLQNPSHLFSGPGLYDISLSVTTSDGCVKDTVRPDYIEVFPLPYANFALDPERTNILNGRITFSDLSIGNIDTWNWDFGTGDVSPDQNPVYVYTDTGTHIVQLQTITVNGCEDVISHQVIIDPDFMFYVPNSFTPNGNRLNDHFRGYGEGVDWDTYQLFVYNRWGEEIFYTADIDTPWRGRYKDMETEAGVYVWKILLTDILGVQHVYRGHVTLLR